MRAFHCFRQIPIGVAAPSDFGFEPANRVEQLPPDKESPFVDTTDPQGTLEDEVPAGTMTVKTVAVDDTGRGDGEHPFQKGGDVIAVVRGETEVFAASMVRADLGGVVAARCSSVEVAESGVASGEFGRDRLIPLLEGRVYRVIDDDDFMISTGLDLQGTESASKVCWAVVSGDDKRAPHNFNNTSSNGENDH